MKCPSLVRLSLVSCCGLLFAQADAMAAPLSPQAVFAQVRSQVVAAESRNEKDEVLSAFSAVATGGEFLATTCEVLTGAKQLVVNGVRTEIPATSLQRDELRNLCLVRIDSGSKLIPVALRTTPVTAGEHVYAVSNALGLGIGISEGVVAGLRDFGENRYIQFTAAVAPGSEGGGLFDSEGRLIGVLDYQRRDGQNVNFAAPVQWIAEVPARQSRQDARNALRDKAFELQRAKQWPELVAHAKAWTSAYPQDAEAWRWYAGAAETADDTATAERAYEQATKLDPSSLPATAGLIRAQAKLKKFAEARALLQSAIATRQEDPDLWLLSGWVHLSAGEVNAAEQAFRKSLALFPWNSSAYGGLVAIAEQRGDIDSLVSLWTRLESLRPDYPEASWQLTDAWLRKNRPDKAYAIVERVLRRHPDSGDAWFWRGTVLQRMDRPSLAIEALKRSVGSKPGNPAWAWGKLGDIQYEQGLYADAIASFREAIRADPDPQSTFWRARLGVVLKDAGQFDEALALFETLAKDKPDDPQFWRQIGYVNAFMNRKAESIPALEKSLNLDPKQGKVWTALIETYNYLGRRDDVLRAYRQLRDIDAQFADLAYRFVVGSLEDAR